MLSYLDIMAYYQWRDRYARFREEDHPRDDSGQFTSVSGSTSSTASDDFGQLVEGDFPETETAFSELNEVNDTFSDFFGRKVRNRQVAMLTGGAHIRNTEVTTDGEQLNISVTSKSILAERKIHRDENGDLVLHAELLMYKQGGGAGKGTKAFANMVRNAVALGCTKITCFAAGGGGDSGRFAMNGYYTWPRLGYDGDIPATLMAKDVWRNAPEHIQSATRVSDLMKTQEGRDWWKENGMAFDATFDLSEGSQSRKALSRYLKEKEEKAKKTPVDKNESDEQPEPYEMPPDDLDADLLDSIWDSIDD